MPDPSTARLALYKSKSDGSELVNYPQDLGQNWDKVDLAVGLQACTSTTRPATPFSGKGIMETDTGYRTSFSNGTAPASASWVEIPNSSSTFGSNLKLASGAQLVFGVDTNLYRSAASVLKTDDSFVTVGNVTVGGNLTVNGIGQTQYVAKTADQTITSSATLTNDTHIVLPVAANAVYTFELDLYTTSAAFTGDFKTTFTCPAGATFDMHGIGAHQTDLAAGTQSNGEWLARLANASGGAALAYGVGTGLTAIRVHGRLVMSATAGNFQMQWAQNTVDASGTTLKAGSFMNLTRVA